MTIEEMAKFIASVVLYDTEQTDDDYTTWESLKVSGPVRNTFVVVEQDGTQHLVTVKVVRNT